MSETQDKTVESVSFGKVFIEKDGSLYLIKKTQTFKFLLINQSGDLVYSKDPFKTEESHVSPESLGYSKREEWLIYVYKEVTDELENKMVYYELPLTFEIPDEKRYFTAYFKKAKSGRVFLIYFDSGTTAEINVNDAEFTKRGKAKRLPDDTLIQKGSPIFTLNASGELERRLPENDVW